jgi:hypothetical protein
MVMETPELWGQKTMHSQFFIVKLQAQSHHRWRDGLAPFLEARGGRICDGCGVQ